MRNPTKEPLIPKTLLFTGAALNSATRLLLVFYGLLLGGSPGPGYERTVPTAYVGIMALGLLGAVLGLLGVALKNKSAILIAAVLGALGSVPLFLLELPAVGIAFLLMGTIPLFGLLKRNARRQGGL